MHIGQQVRVRDGIHAHAGRTGTIHKPARRGWFVVFDAPIIPGSTAGMAAFEESDLAEKGKYDVV